MSADFGSRLKEWRAKRRMSQLDLGLAANVSARHVSFLETGRSHPSRSMVIQLSEALDIPRASRNDLLTAAGFASVYVSRDLDAPDMVQIRQAVDWMLVRHNPFPGFALDRHWTIVDMNKAAAVLFDAAGLGRGQSLAGAMADDVTFGGLLENWVEIGAHMIVRLRMESRYFGGDPVLDRTARRIAAQIGTASPPVSIHTATVPAHYRFGEGRLSLFSTLSQFSSAEDIALSDLKIELMFPADGTSRDFLLALGNDAPV